MESAKVAIGGVEYIFTDSIIASIQRAVERSKTLGKGVEVGFRICPKGQNRKTLTAGPLCAGPKCAVAEGQCEEYAESTPQFIAGIPVRPWVTFRRLVALKPVGEFHTHPRSAEPTAKDLLAWAIQKQKGTSDGLGCITDTTGLKTVCTKPRIEVSEPVVEELNKVYIKLKTQKPSEPMKAVFHEYSVIGPETLGLVKPKVERTPLDRALAAYDAGELMQMALEHNILMKGSNEALAKRLIDAGVI